MKSFSNQTFSEIVKERTSITDCEFIGCIFDNCKFTDCSFIDCTFSECKFKSSSLTNLQIKNAGMLFSVFEECNLIGIDWMKFQSGAVAFPIQSFEKCFLKYNHFEQMNFRKFNFLKSSITGSSFINCNLNESNFNGCNLHDTEFSGCDLRKSDFCQASGYSINPTENRIKGAKFSLPEAVRLLNSFGIVLKS